MRLLAGLGKSAFIQELARPSSRAGRKCGVAKQKLKGKAGADIGGRAEVAGERGAGTGVTGPGF